MSSDTIRRQILARRSEEPKESIDRVSLAAMKRLLELPDLVNCKTLGSYSAIRGEVNPSMLFEVERFDIALPAITQSGSLRYLFPVGELVEGPYGVWQPDSGAEIHPMKLDAVIVPLVAVDPDGNRLGYGGGYYDRTFASRKFAPKPPLLIGICYEYQIVDSLSPSVSDVPMDLVISDVEVIRVNIPQMGLGIGED